MTTPLDRFPTETAGLPEARSPELFDMAGGGRFDLRIAPVVKQLGDASVRMLWMAHCHIAEHHESGMMFSFNVDP